jgi:flagellar hook-basal body complex protein FliE
MRVTSSTDAAIAFGEAAGAKTGRLGAPTQTSESASPLGVSFGDVLGATVGRAAEAGRTAAAQADAVAEGTLDDLHGAMISAKEAEISLKLVGSIRNKLLDAFHEIWRTSV